jgi:uncharacterized protein YqgV (UPF0045/DUF77 family)
MLNDQGTDASKVLVELTVIPMSNNGHVREGIARVLNTLDRTGLFYQRTHNGSFIEGEWKDVSTLIFSCYERMHEEFPQGFLEVSIR